MLDNDKRKIIRELIKFINEIETFNNMDDLNKHLYKLTNIDIINFKKDPELFINIIKKRQYPITNYTKHLYLLPIFKNYKVYEIIYWINNAKVTDKKSKKETDFLYDIYTYQNETDFNKKIFYLEIIINKMINYIKYSNKDEKNK